MKNPPAQQYRKAEPRLRSGGHPMTTTMCVYTTHALTRAITANYLLTRRLNSASPPGRDMQHVCKRCGIAPV